MTTPTEREACDDSPAMTVMSPLRYEFWKLWRRYEIATKGIRWRLKLRIEGGCQK